MNKKEDGTRLAQSSLKKSVYLKTEIKLSQQIGKAVIYPFGL
jgi:hypothetical protein